MQFGQAIPLLQRPKYEEGTAMAPARDHRNNSFLWKKAYQESRQQFANGQALQKVSRELSKQRRRIVGGFIPTPPQIVMFPFKIYQIGNSAGDAPDNLTLQIRGGLVGFRTGYNASGTAATTLYQGNYELPLQACGTDDTVGITPFDYSSGLFSEDYERQPTQNHGGSKALNADGTATLICENLIGSANPPQVQITVPASIAGGAGNSIFAAFFIRIVDDPTAGYYTQLWGKCTGQGIGHNGFDGSIPPFVRDGSNISDVTFAIGIVRWTTSGDTAPVVSQAQTGHLVNRYLEWSPQSIASNGAFPKMWSQGMVDRGGWNLNHLSGKVFYPGDLVYDDTVAPITISGTTAYLQYVYAPITVPAQPGVETSINSNFNTYGYHRRS